MTKRQHRKGAVTDEELDELLEFWRTAEDDVVLRAMKRGFRDAGPVGRAVQGPTVRLMGRRRKGDG